MTRIEFEDIKFKRRERKIIAIFQNMFYFDINIDKILEIGKFRLVDGAIIFPDIKEKRAKNKLNLLINKGFTELKSIMTNNRAVYIHKNSGIPLIGSQYFGIIDRNTNMVELRPNTGCNLNCIYCSIDEGKNSKKTTDFIVEKDYLVQELIRLLKQKQCDDIEVYINPQGEPLLYRPIVSLVRDLSNIPEIKRISINTNGIMLSRKLVNSLKNAGLTLLIVSINSLEEELARKIAGCSYNVTRILKMIDYAKKKLDVHISPVYIPGVNDEEIEKLIKYCIDHDLRIYIQNFLYYKHGRKPVKPIKIEDFYAKLGIWENKFDIKLRVEADDFQVKKTAPLKNPFRKGEKANAKIICPGRFNNEMLAVAKNRVIQINCNKTSGNVLITITRTKHNIINSLKKN